MSFVELLRSYGAPDEIIALAERLEAAAPPAEIPDDAGPDAHLLQYGEDVEPLTYDELGQLDEFIAALPEDDDAPTELIIAAADVKDVIVGELATHDEIAAAEETRRAEAAAKLTGTANGSDDGNEDNEDDDEDDSGGEGGDDATGEADDAGADNTPEPVVAAGRRTADRSSIVANRRRSARRQPDPEPAPDPAQPLSRFEFAHGIHDPTGQGWTTELSKVDAALVNKRSSWRGGKGSGDGVIEDVPVATLTANYPEDRQLIDGSGQMLSAAHVSNKVQAAIDAGREWTINQNNGLVAACGLCEISTPIYSLETLGVTTRPIRDQALVSFQGQPRGRVEAQTPPTLGDVEGGVSIWTVTDDENACDPDSEYFGTKPCVRVECGDPISCELHAVPICLNMGNFQARSFPELQAAWTRLSLVAQARLAEQALFQAMVDQSTVVSDVTESVSAVRDVLAAVDLAATGIRSRNRMEANDPMIVILPETFRTIARTDIARQMPGGPTQGNLAIADAMILEWFTSRFLSVVWSMDYDLIGDQAPNEPLAALPSTIDALVYPAGTFIHVDGGQLDLGLVRDTTTNATNDFQIFSETFECVLKLGPESLALSIEVCPSGAVNGTLDPTGFCAA